MCVRMCVRMHLCVRACVNVSYLMQVFECLNVTNNAVMSV